MYSDKPKIVSVKPLTKNGWDVSKGQWLCHNDYYITAQGNTPQEAYHKWVIKMGTLSRIPRKGVWNKPSVNDWYRTGCRTVRSYFGSNRFIGYIPTTDELVLQG